MERYQAFLLNHKEPLDVLKLDYAGEIYFAASDPYSDLSESTRAYHQAKSILDYRPVSNPTFFLTSKNLLQRDTFYFPLEEERKLNNLIRAGDLEGAMEKCDSLIETNLQAAPSVVGINQFFDMLELNISRLMGKEQRVALPGGAIASVDARRERLRALLGSLKQAEVPVREASEEFSVIVDYIDENLVDPQLSLYSVANHFSMNPSALSKMIKRELGIGYLDFVNQKRIELAKAHLRSGRISIRDLAQTVGFDNDATLRRLFKKYEGITPTQYHE